MCGSACPFPGAGEILITGRQLISFDRCDVYGRSSDPHDPPRVLSNCLRYEGLIDGGFLRAANEGGARVLAESACILLSRSGAIRAGGGGKRPPVGRSRSPAVSVSFYLHISQINE